MFYIFLLFLSLLIQPNVMAKDIHVLSYDDLMNEGFHNLISKDFKQAEKDYLEALNRYCKVQDRACSMAYSMLRDINLFQGDVSEAIKYSKIIDDIFGRNEVQSKTNIKQMCESDYYHQYKIKLILFCKREDKEHER